MDHVFIHKSLADPETANQQPYIKISFFFQKLPHVSYEQFYTHWQTVHADLALASERFGACNIMRYVQTHYTPELKHKARDIGLEQLDYDGCSELYVKEWHDFERFYGSPEFANNTRHRRDTANFMAMPIKILIGAENVIFGQGLTSMGGRDGLQKSDLTKEGHQD